MSNASHQQHGHSSRHSPRQSSSNTLLHLKHTIATKSLHIFLLSIVSLALVVLIACTVTLNLMYVDASQLPHATNGTKLSDNSQTETPESNPFMRFVPGTVLVSFCGSLILCLVGWKNLDLIREVIVLRRQKNLRERFYSLAANTDHHDHQLLEDQHAQNTGTLSDDEQLMAK